MEDVSVSSFKLGEVDGKKEARDPDFEQLFYLGDGYYDELEEQNKYIIIGRKGTGKSVLINYYKKQIDKKDNAFCKIISVPSFMKKKLRTFDYDKLNTEELEEFWKYVLLRELSGLKIDDYLKTLQTNYQVTADIENRALSFEEVKKELDAGQIIQADAFDQNETAPQGSENNVGHSLAIVGYVLPADGDTTKHAPYYEIWNPWWGQIYCVSSKAPYFNLEGTQYKWTRTWHNWRKV